MKNLKVILALTMVMAFVITSCNKEELFQNKSTTKDELSSKTTDNAFMELVNDDVYPANLLSSKTIQAFNESIIMLGDQIASANGSVLEANLNEDQIKLFFDLLAEQDYNNVNESLGSRFRCGFVFNKRYKSTLGKCITNRGYWCNFCPID